MSAILLFPLPLAGEERGPSCVALAKQDGNGEGPSIDSSLTLTSPKALPWVPFLSRKRARTGSAS
jgi:hypothetical protein